MAGPGDQLFMALAQAKARPSKALRAVESAGDAGQGIIGGYMQGKSLQQDLAKYKLLNTPLGQIFPDPASIPGGLTPDHKVSDLMNMVPVLPYVPTEAGGNIASMMMGANPASPAPANPAPLGGTSNPAPPPGTTNLAAIQGTGAGAQDNVPQGTPPAVIGNSGPAHIKRMSMNDIAKYGPLLNDVRQGRQFQQGQNAEESRFERGQAAEESRFNRGKTQQESEFQRGHMATVAEKVAPSIANLANVKQFTSELEPLIAANSPLPGTGNLQASAARAMGGIGTAQMKNSLSINDTAAKLSAVLDKELAGRFNENEANLLKQTMVPNGNDQPAYAQEKLNKLKAFTHNLETGNDQIIRNMGAAITGGKISTESPTSQIRGQGQTPPNSGTGDPEADAAIQRIQSSSLNPQAKQARIMAVKARSGRHG